MLRLPEGAREQERFQQTMKECYDCHQLGGKATREFPSYVTGETHLAKWDTRTKYGPSGPSMGAFSSGSASRGKHLRPGPKRSPRRGAGRNAPPRPPACSATS